MTTELTVIVSVTSNQRRLLWTLLQFDTATTVYEIVGGNQTTAEKTQRIVSQMDFVFNLRVAVASLPVQGGVLRLGELGRAYLSLLLDGIVESLLSPEIRATLNADRMELQMSIGDTRDGFVLPAASDRSQS